MAVPFAETFGYAGRRGVDRREARGARIVYAEPQDAAHGIGQPIAGLSQHPEAGLLCGDGAFVQVLLSVYAEVHRTPAVRQVVSPCPDVVAHIHRRILEVVAHQPSHLFDAQFLCRFNEQRHAFRRVVAHRIVEVLFHLPFGDAVEGAPYAGLAGAQ